MSPCATEPEKPMTMFPITSFGFQVGFQFHKSDVLVQWSLELRYMKSEVGHRHHFLRTDITVVL